MNPKKDPKALMFDEFMEKLEKLTHDVGFAEGLAAAVSALSRLPAELVAKATGAMLRDAVKESLTETLDMAVAKNAALKNELNELKEKIHNV